jgi:N-acetylneuraminate synthase
MKEPVGSRSPHELYQQAHTPWEWHAPIMQRAHFSRHAVLQHAVSTKPRSISLQDLDVPCFKIASFENNHLR